MNMWLTAETELLSNLKWTGNTAVNLWCGKFDTYISVVTEWLLIGYLYANVKTVCIRVTEQYIYIYIYIVFFFFFFFFVHIMHRVFCFFLLGLDCGLGLGYSI